MEGVDIRSVKEKLRAQHNTIGNCDKSQSERSPVLQCGCASVGICK